MPDDALMAAFIAELASKSDLVWVAVPGRAARPLWNVWHDEAVAIVTGGLEQANPGFADGDTVNVLLRSHENRARQVVVVAMTEEITPDSDAWNGVAKALHAARLNPPDGEDQPDRWRRESQLWLLRPTGDLIEGPGAQSTSPHRAEPIATEATTLTRRPFHAGRATKKRR